MHTTMYFKYGMDHEVSWLIQHTGGGGGGGGGGGIAILYKSLLLSPRTEGGLKFNPRGIFNKQHNYLNVPGTPYVLV